MAAPAPKSKIQADRDARLDRLSQATDKWATDETNRLNYEKDFLKSVLKGRTGSGRLASQNVVDTYKIVVDSIKTFLEG